MTPEDIAAPLAVEMTILTGEMWRTNAADHRTLVYSDSACFSLNQAWNERGRLRISATAPLGIQEKTDGESITCAMSRGAEKIARDIITRILTSARDHLRESITYNDKREREKNAADLRKKIMMRFAENEYNGKLYKRTDRNNRLWIEINNYDNSATIEIHMPFAKCVELLKIIRNGEFIK